MATLSTKVLILLGLLLIASPAHAAIDSFTGFETGGPDDVVTYTGGAASATDLPRTGLWYADTSPAGQIPVAGEVLILAYYGSGKVQCGVELADGGGLQLVFKSSADFGEFAVTQLPERTYTAVELCNNVIGASTSASCSLFTDGLLRATGAKSVGSADTVNATEVRGGVLTGASTAYWTHTRPAADSTQCVRAYLYYDPSDSSQIEFKWDDLAFSDAFASNSPSIGVGFVAPFFPDADGAQAHWSPTCSNPSITCSGSSTHDAVNETGNTNTQRTDDPLAMDGEGTYIGNNANPNEQSWKVNQWNGAVTSEAVVSMLAIRAGLCTNASNTRCGRVVVFDATSSCTVDGNCGGGAPNECVDSTCKQTGAWHFDGAAEGTDCNATPQTFQWFSEFAPLDYEGNAWLLAEINSDRWEFGVERSAAGDCASDGGSGTRVRASAVVIEALIREPDPVPVRNVPDLTGDGQVTVAFGCDSITFGSVNGTCSTDAEVACGCQKICDWAVEKDVCCGADADCSFCSEDSTKQTRKLCTTETDCDTCATSADCNGSPCVSGNCTCTTTGSTCVDACPISGTCIVTKDYVALTCTDLAGVDNCLNCGNPGDTTRAYGSAVGWTVRLPSVLSCSSASDCDSQSTANCRLIKGTWANPDVVVSLCGVNNEHSIADSSCIWSGHDGKICPKNDGDLCQTDPDCASGSGSCTRQACTLDADCNGFGQVCEGDSKCHYGRCSLFTPPTYTCPATTCSTNTDCANPMSLFSGTCWLTCTGDNSLPCLNDTTCSNASAGTCGGERRCICTASANIGTQVTCSTNADCAGTDPLASVGVCSGGVCTCSGPVGCAVAGAACHDQRRQRHEKRPIESLVTDYALAESLVTANHPTSGKPRIHMHVTQPDITDRCDISGWAGQVSRMRRADALAAPTSPHKVNLYELFSVHEDRSATTRDSQLRADGIHPAGLGAAVMGAGVGGYMAAVRPGCSGDIHTLCNFCSWDTDRDDDLDVQYNVGCHDDAVCTGVCLDAAGIDCEGSNCQTAPRCSIDADCTNLCSSGTCGQTAACTAAGKGSCTTWGVGLLCSNDLATACATNADCPATTPAGECTNGGWVWRFGGGG